MELGGSGVGHYFGHNIYDVFAAYAAFAAAAARCRIVYIFYLSWLLLSQNKLEYLSCPGGNPCGQG